MEYSEYLDKSIAAVLEHAEATLEDIQKTIASRRALKRQSTTISYHGLEWHVEGVYARGRPACAYLANGDPGYPAEPSELDDISIMLRQKYGDSDEMSDVLNDSAQDKIIELALANMDDPAFLSDEDIPFRGDV